MDSIKLNKEIVLAQKLVGNNIQIDEKQFFHELSRIYRYSNENMNSKAYIKALRNKLKITSVVASGDQIINSIFFGSKDILGFDISIFPKFYLLLKLAALKVLDREEFIKFFSGRVYSEFLNYDVYCDVSKEMDNDSLEFWDSLFNYFDEYEIGESQLFSNEPTSSRDFVRNNPYLSSDDNYYLVRKLLDNVILNFVDGNIFDLKFEEPRDLYNLSNIIQYSRINFNKSFKESLLEFKEFLEGLPLNENGIVISYLLGVYDFKSYSRIFNEGNYSFEKVEDKKSYLMSFRKK